MNFRTLYSSRNETRENKKAVRFEEHSLTDQNFKDETDVNMILAKYKVTRNPSYLGYGPNGQPTGNPQYGDFGDVGTYQECLEVVMQAEEQFNELPAVMRKEFGNSPEGMLKWIENPDNFERGVELGIFKKPVGNMDNFDVGDSINPPSDIPDVVVPSNKVTSQ